MSEPRRIGHTRVSTKTQTTDRQALLLEAECDASHVENISAIAPERPTFGAVIADQTPGDTFVTLDFDRAFRSSIDAMLTVEFSRNRNVAFRI